MKLSGSQYTDILNEYSQQRFENIRDLNSRTEKLYDEIPRLKEIRDAIASISVQCAKHKLQRSAHVSDSEDAILSKLKADIAALARERSSLLKKYGYPDDYPAISYKCKACRDTGYMEDGEQCRCFKNKIIKLLYRSSNIEDILQRENFSSFDARLYDNAAVDSLLNRTPYENILHIMNTVKEYIKNFDSVYNNLYIYGASGVGKTFLSNCIAGALIDSSHSVICLSAPRLFEILANDTFNRTENIPESLKLSAFLYDCDLLIIDDLGTELMTSFTASELFTCINMRNLNRKSTIISSNLTLPDLSELYSERVFSRIMTYTMIKIIGEDLRIKRALSRQSAY